MSKYFNKSQIYYFVCGLVSAITPFGAAYMASICIRVKEYWPLTVLIPGLCVASFLTYSLFRRAFSGRRNENGSEMNEDDDR